MKRENRNIIVFSVFRQTKLFRPMNFHCEKIRLEPDRMQHCLETFFGVP